MLSEILLIFFGYVVGSIPTGYLLARYFAGINIQEYGSGNIGATNMVRTLGKKYGALTLLGDGVKALLYVWFLKTAYPQDIKLIFLGSLAVLLGNCFSLFLKFKGGKGGVTTYGVFLAISPYSALSILTYVLILKFLKSSAIGTLTSVIVLPLVMTVFLPPDDMKIYLVGLSICFVIIVWLRHIQNIKDIIRQIKTGGTLK